MKVNVTVFEFTSYEFEPAKKRVLFHYKTVFADREPLIFTETILLPHIPDLKGVPEKLLKKMLEGLHITLGTSYYKCYCAKDIKVPYDLSKQEADFFTTLYKKGLGEFFYRNTLNPKNSPKFPFSKNAQSFSYNIQRPKNSSSCLVGIGGGKDSIVSVELLKENNFKIEAFLVKNVGASPVVENNVIKNLGLKTTAIERVLDPQVRQPHKYNGHIPISSIFASLGIFSAILYDYKYVIVSNEHSSNFGNVEYKGLQVNHQWSKSYEFEKMFQEYVRSSLTPDVFYFSLLRPFYEIRIVKLFTKYKKHFPDFTSCNANFKIKGKEHEGLWCGTCAKCLFVFMLLSAFLSKKELVGIFKKNLYEDETLLPLFKDLLGFGTMKPFDCVGPFEESQTALFLAKKNFGPDFIIRTLGKKVRYHKEVFETNKNNSLPEEFKFMGMEHVLIAGFGREGKITKQYLKKYYPKLKVKIGDAELDKNFLEGQKDFDIAIKTPGIQKGKMTIPYNTATNIFFGRVKGRNMIIGVTGSKGKSTTSSLIYHILKTAGKKVELLGNIGKPMLDAVLNQISKDTIFVLELSSGQLDDIHYSPDIAVVTNLFPEHMDYHGSLKNYYEAKKNIIRFQNPKEYFVYSEKTAHWLKDYKGKAIPFSSKKYESSLLGEHNESNIKAAVAVTELLKIPQEKIKKAIKSFEGLPHRLQLVGEYKGIRFYDDAISTTPESTIMAIKSLPHIGTIFLGGTDRGYDFSQLEKVIKKYKIKNIVLFPDSGKRIIKNTKGLNILKTSSMKEAVKFAYKNTEKGSICLLSCASPSYSLWKNFEEKGNEFKKAVKSLAK